MFDIVWQSDQVLVIDKHAGVNFHSEQGEAGLFATLTQSFPSLYPVHRLDKPTSGLLVMAKTADANRQLCEQFRQRQVDKYYLAISGKKPRKKQGSVVGDMTSARRGAWMLTRTRHNPARTAFVSCHMAPGLRLFVVKPATGRTHQIRVALKSVGAPIVGDTLYGAEPSDRLYLHAYSLGFEINGEYQRFTQPPSSGALFGDTAFTHLMSGDVIDVAEPWNMAWPAC
ncbi:TIGR01621 family pseudouridine synthase [Gilvimarinus japonicus]|jgi:tRNA pseudouridine32 synthase/23S rRNA pseudouridine746 synthase|uniref:TIGR01621 family pseudouridine synthase n=1 Tax=Gilvimarinus japonicus TaxID=1796469 RepID=A0ABV7HND2_9GAMM